MRRFILLKAEMLKNSVTVMVKTDSSNIHQAEKMSGVGTT